MTVFSLLPKAENLCFDSWQALKVETFLFLGGRDVKHSESGENFRGCFCLKEIEINSMIINL